mgnify:CR=1 FL=1
MGCVPFSYDDGTRYADDCTDRYPEHRSPSDGALLGMGSPRRRECRLDVTRRGWHPVLRMPQQPCILSRYCSTAGSSCGFGAWVVVLLSCSSSNISRTLLVISLTRSLSVMPRLAANASALSATGP